MHSSLVSKFSKRISCPASQTLLAFRRSRLGYKENAYIEAHLAYCDFCNAELQLLTLHRNDAEEYAFAEMPARLRRLAQGLLRNSSAPFKAFTNLRVNHRA
jgi:hypothetical protein